MSIELIGSASAPLAARVVGDLFTRVGEDPRYRVLSIADGTLQAQFRRLTHTLPEREDFSLTVHSSRVFLTFYAGTLGEIEETRREIERWLDEAGVSVSLCEE